MQSNHTEKLSLGQKKKLLLQLLEKKNGSNANCWPLSLGQQSLWFLHQIDPSDTSYNTGFALRIQSPVKQEAMHKALQQLFSKHPLLTSVFRMKQDTPVCMPFQGSLHFEILDASSFNEQQLYEVVVNKYRQPFDLTSGPVTRCYLFTRSERDHIFLFSIHHIIYDDGSTPVILKELIYQYLEACGYISSSFKDEPPEPYYKYVLSEKVLLSSDKGKAAEKFWQEQLQQAPILPSLQAYKQSGKKGGHTVDYY